MTGQVAIVTDSTACLPPSAASEHGVTVVPLEVVISGKGFPETGSETSRRLVEALRHRWPATTSRPGPELFSTAYRTLAEEGVASVVSLHLSAEMSGTYDSARIAAKTAPLPVEVIDTRTLGMGLGYAALTAAEAAAAGGDTQRVALAARKRASELSVFFYVDTLEYLRRGGRIGAAQALVGSALAVKPILHVADGRVEMLEKVRTATRAIGRLEEIAVERAGRGRIDVAVHHLDAPERAAVLAERLRVRLPGLADLRVSEVGAVIGAHVGPGLLGVVVAPR